MESDTETDVVWDCVVVELTVSVKVRVLLGLALFVDDSVDERIVDSDGVFDNDVVAETVAEVVADEELV